MLIYLTIREPNHSKIVECKEFPVILGRSPKCHIVLESDSVSGKHAQIDFFDHGFTITDLKSTNKTYLNGKPLDSGALHDGDSIQLGDVSIDVQLTEQLEKTRITEIQGKTLLQSRLIYTAKILIWTIVLFAAILLNPFFNNYLIHWPPNSYVPILKSASETFFIRIVFAFVLGTICHVITRKFRLKSALQGIVIQVGGTWAVVQLFHLSEGNVFDTNRHLWSCAIIAVNILAGYVLTRDILIHSSRVLRIALSIVLMTPFYYTEVLSMIPKKLTPGDNRIAALEVAVPLFRTIPKAKSLNELMIDLDSLKIKTDDVRQKIINDQKEDRAEKN
jgi:pSer/pThr/pTyr-binding forkhead associated (FHA) protein